MVTYSEAEEMTSSVIDFDLLEEEWGVSGILIDSKTTPGYDLVAETNRGSQKVGYINGDGELEMRDGFDRYRAD